ncbi:MAG TPA: hypothetical protein ENH66_00005, partial [Candidatus Nealsonbacteria bacterium]|nr:hypothetical protein [Candidatus Nealsonbacteria bacterium]
MEIKIKSVKIPKTRQGILCKIVILILSAVLITSGFFFLKIQEAAGIQPIPPNRSFENLPNVTKKQGLYKITFGQWSEVEIPEVDTPEVKLKKWGDETFIKVKYANFDKKVKPKQENKKLKWKGKDVEVHLYSLEPTEQMDEGGFEFEVILKKKPLANKIVLDIETQGLKFYYQPEISDEEAQRQLNTYNERRQMEKPDEVSLEDWQNYLASLPITLLETKRKMRPENVVGSYAVYHDTKQPIYASQEEADKYKTGIAFHIYRPMVIDNLGAQIWADLDIDEMSEELTITVDQGWLNAATYPVIVDPTFGYTTIGGSSANINGGELFGSLFTSPSDVDTGTSITFYVASSVQSSPAKGVMVLHTANVADLLIIANGVGNAVTCSTTPGWRTSILAGTPSLTGSTTYIIMWITGQSAWGQDFYYNSGDASQGHYDQTNNYATPENPSYSLHNNNKYSIYITYDSTNATPTISSVSDTPDPVNSGSNTTFSTDWNDTDSGDLVKAHICKTDAITTQTCDGGSWADSASFVTDDPIDLTYEAQDGDAGSNDYYVFVCDDDNACSSSTSGTFTVNRLPTTPTPLGPTAYVDGSWGTDNTPSLTFTTPDPDTNDQVKFQIQVDDSADFGSVVVDYVSGFATESTARTFTIGQAEGSGSYTTGEEDQTLSDGSYYWRVKGIDDDAAESSYATANSGSIAFKVDTTAPTNVSISSVTAGSTTQLTVTADTAIDSGAGLHSTPYFFQETSGNSGASSSSAYQASTSFIDAGLTANTQYTYRVKVKDTTDNGSSYSSTSSAYTLAPTPTNFSGTATLSTISLSVDSFTNATVGSSGYYFYRSGDSPNSGWIQTNSWQGTGLSCGTSYAWYVKYRNGDGTETATTSLTKSTNGCGGAGVIGPPVSTTGQ